MPPADRTRAVGVVVLDGDLEFTVQEFATVRPDRLFSRGDRVVVEHSFCEIGSVDRLALVERTLDQLVRRCLRLAPAHRQM